MPGILLIFRAVLATSLWSGFFKRRLATAIWCSGDVRRLSSIEDILLELLISQIYTHIWQKFPIRIILLCVNQCHFFSPSFFPQSGELVKARSKIKRTFPLSPKRESFLFQFMSLPITFWLDDATGTVVNSCPHARDVYECALTGKDCHVMKCCPKNGDLQGSTTLAPSLCTTPPDYLSVYTPNDLSNTDVYLVEDSWDFFRNISATVIDILGRWTRIVRVDRVGQIEADLTAGEIHNKLIVLLDGELYSRETWSIARDIVKTGATVISTTGITSYPTLHQSAGIVFSARKDMNALRCFLSILKR